MPLTHLHRIDPARNMARFYHVRLARTLFGETCLVKTWGRIGSGGRTVFETFEAAEEASKAAERVIRAKMRRGYVAERRGANPENGRQRQPPE